MKKPKLATLGLIGLAYGGIMVMTATDGPRAQSSAAEKAAAKQADRAYKALAKRQAADAIAAAEQAVAFAPRIAGYRMLLGQSYLQAGRFGSAGQAFGDVLALEPGHGKAALNLALTQIAGGDWQAARQTLATHAGGIPASDRGLAMALAGDTAGAVALLTEVARSPQASPKVRQNLALAYALAGQWQAARVVAAADMSPADVDARLQQWAVFAQPQTATDQVAGLLGVQPVADGGQPVALALNAPVAPVAVAAAPVVEPVPAVVPEVTKSVASPEPVAVAVALPAPAVAPVAAVRFGPRQEVVQALPVQTIASPAGPIKVAATEAARAPARSIGARVARAVAPSGGDWHVQLGAFDSAGVAKDAWGRAQRRFAGFAGRSPNGMTFRTQSASFYRLSVGGFDRASAYQACRQYKARGGDCFVRQNAGDQIAAWARPRHTQLAMR